MTAVAVPRSPTIAIDRSADPRLHYVLRLADTSLVLGQRLGEWVGHAPAIEEDMGLANLALDFIGQARLLFAYAGELDGRGLGEDELAFLRDEPDFFNLLIVEQPNGDFARTIVRQFLVDALQVELFQALATSTDQRLADIAAKAQKETRYHLRYSQAWVVRLGDGTAESHQRAQVALDELWRFTSEFFQADAVEAAVTAAGIGPPVAGLRAPWLARVSEVLHEATLACPADARLPLCGKQGRHTEHLGRMLAEMQFLQRAYPGASW